MNKFLFFIVAVILLAGCAEDLEFYELAGRGDAPESNLQPLTRSLERAVYNEVVDAWMGPQADPYTLENFQRAYDKLAAGKSLQKLSKAQAAEFIATKKLNPTHYALKIYPKNEEEQWRIETMEDVQVAYIPFDWVQLTREEAGKVEQSKTRAAGNTFAEKNPYTVTYDNTVVYDGGPTGPVTYQLPILYTVWPVEKPLPTDLEYVVDYEIFLPDKEASVSQLSNDAVPALWNEAWSTVRGLNPSILPSITPTATRATTSLPLFVNVQDDTPGVSSNLPYTTGNVPMANLKVRFQDGSYIFETVTNSDGLCVVEFTPGTPSPPYSLTATIIITYQDPQGRWKIMPDNGTYPLGAVYPNRLIYTPGFPINTPATLTLSSAGGYQENEIHRAVNYFFNGQSIFSKNVPSGGMRIIANDFASGSTRGSYSPGNRTINIYNLGRTKSQTIGTTLHEIAHHGVHSTLFNNRNEEFIIEAFAPFVGVCLGENYYQSLGWTHPGGNFDIMDQARQDWTKFLSSYYSPLFVDLWDSFNQSTYYAGTPNDDISNVPASVIWNIITTCPTWVSCRSKLESYAGTGPGKYYSRANFDKWIIDFDEWND
jgi:hypothetical protein